MCSAPFWQEQWTKIYLQNDPNAKNVNLMQMVMVITYIHYRNNSEGIALVECVARKNSRSEGYVY